MWTKTGIESEGQYAVTQEISNYFKIIIADQHYASRFKELTLNNLSYVIKNLEEINLQEVDFWLGILPGCDFHGIRTGEQVLNKSNNKIVILGFSQNYAPESQINNISKADLESMNITMKVRERCKAVCLYQNNSITEIILEDPQDLVPIQYASDFRYLDEQSLQKTMMKSLEREVSPKDFKDLEYQDRIKHLTINHQLLKFFQKQIQLRGQSFIDLMQNNGVLDSFLDYVFKKSTQPYQDNYTKLLSEQYMEENCYLLRQKSLETNEYFGTYKGITGVIQNNKYIVLKGLINSRPDDTLIYPINGSINIEYNIKSPIMVCKLAHQILDLNKDYFEMIIIPSKMFEDDPQNAFQLINQAQVTLISDSLNIVQIYRTMRNIASQDPANFESLTSKIILQIDDESFIKLFNPRLIRMPQVPQFSDKDSTLNVLCSLLSSWGNCSPDLTNYLKKEKCEDLIQMQQKLSEVLNPDFMNVILEERQGPPQGDSFLGTSISMSTEIQMKSNTERIFMESLNQLTLEEEPIDINDYQVIRQRINNSIEKYILPLEESRRQFEEVYEERAYELINQNVKLSHGKIFIRDYEMALINYNLLKCRKTFISILQHCHFEKLLPYLLKTDKNKKKFAHFLKISYNEATKSKSSDSKSTLNFVQNIIKNLLVYSHTHKEYEDFIIDFYYNDLVQGGIQALQELNLDEANLFRAFYQSEEDSAKYGTPKLFKFMTLILMKNSKHVLTNKATSLANIQTLSLCYALYLSQSSTKWRDKYLVLALEILYFCQDNFQNLEPKCIEFLLNNKLVLSLGESMINTKDNEKINHGQKILTELYIAHHKLQCRFSAQSQKNTQDMMLFTKYMHQMRKMSRVIEESHQNKSVHYLKYLQFYKDMDKELLEFLKNEISTSHNMYDVQIKAYKKIENCKRMKITIGQKSQIPKFQSLMLTSDEAGKHVIKEFSQDDINDTQHPLSFEIFRKDFYLHYPSNQTAMIAFGTQKRGRLGNNKPRGQTEIINIHLPREMENQIQIKEIIARKKFMAILDTHGQIFFTGTIKNQIETLTMKQLKLPNSMTVENWAVGLHTIIAKGIDKKWYAFGKNRNNHISVDDAYKSESFKEITSNMEILKNKKVIHFASGSHFSLFVTSQGKLYGRGTGFMESIGITQKSTAYIPLPRQYVAKRVYCSQDKAKSQSCAIVEVYDKQEKCRKFLSAGKSDNGLLGQGQDVTISTTFKPIDLDFKNIYFVKIEMFKKQALAITSNGQLYCWGTNDTGLLGLQRVNEKYFKPTVNESFKNSSILNFACGEFHSILASASHQNGQTSIYTFGQPQNKTKYQYLGISEQDISPEDKFIWHLKYFDGYQLKHIAAGKKASYVIFDQPLSRMNKKMHMITASKYEAGALHLFLDKNGYLARLPESQYSQMKKQLPDICLAFKHPVVDMESKFHSLLINLTRQLSTYIKINRNDDFICHDGVQCNDTFETIIGPRYFTKFQTSSCQQTKSYNYCEDSFFKTKDTDIDPLIFLRLAKPLDSYLMASLNFEFKAFDLGSFYKKCDYYGIDIEIRPDYKSEINNNLIGFGQDLFDFKTKLQTYFDHNKIQLVKEFAEQYDLQEDSLTKPIKKLKKLRNKFISLDNPNDESIKNLVNLKYKQLLTLPEEAFDFIKQILIMQNKYFQRFMRTVQMSVVKYPLYQKYGWQNYLETVKREILFNEKRKVINSMIAKLPQTDEKVITINRRRAMEFISSGLVDNEGKETITGQIFQQIRKFNFNSFMKNNVDRKAFEVNFEGEYSRDAGGPFRECITDMCKELQSDSLPLLIRTPNNKNNHGLYQECWIPNPQSLSPNHKQMFKFLGCMIGWAIRSTSSLQLDLPPIFWKKVLDQQVDINDLKMIDTFTWQVVQDLEQHKNLSAEEFESVVQESFVTLLSDGTEKELIFNGKSKLVTLDNLDEYIDLLIKTRLSEFDTQMKIIKEGINMIMPQNILFFMTWQEVDLRATGAKTINTEKLKAITAYNSCTKDSTVIKQFWIVFDSLSEEEKSLYLKFVWGRSRLPLNLDELNRKHQIEYYQRAKDQLPTAQTCFFKIYLSDYSTEDTMREKLIQAFTLCGDIDADR